jgi:hypothetical protein
MHFSAVGWKPAPGVAPRTKRRKREDSASVGAETGAAREAQQALTRSATGLAPTTRGMVGLCWVDQVVVDATVPCVYLFTDSGMLDPVGFAWCPCGASPECADVNLPAGWYVYEDSEWRCQ